MAENPVAICNREKCRASARSQHAYNLYLPVLRTSLTPPQRARHRIHCPLISAPREHNTAKHQDFGTEGDSKPCHYDREYPVQKRASSPNKVYLLIREVNVTWATPIEAWRIDWPASCANPIRRWLNTSFPNGGLYSEYQNFLNNELGEYLWEGHKFEATDVYW